MTIRGSPAVSREALNSRLVELSEDDEFESFIARVPISFGSHRSHIVSDISSMLDLMTYPDGGDVTFAQRLHNFCSLVLREGEKVLGPLWPGVRFVKLAALADLMAMLEKVTH
jgi:hypothetical protein